MTLLQLNEQQSEAAKLCEEKKEMTEYTDKLNLNLKSIENQTQHLLQEKRVAEEK